MKLFYCKLPCLSYSGSLCKKFLFRGSLLVTGIVIKLLIFASFVNAEVVGNVEPLFM